MLTTQVTVRELADAPGAFALVFEVTGVPGIAVALALCFRPGGELRGVKLRECETDAFILAEGQGRYAVGCDEIEFGPGVFGPNRINVAGEEYSWRNDQLKAEGHRVYLTGVTPSRLVLTIKVSGGRVPTS